MNLVTTITQIEVTEVKTTKGNVVYPAIGFAVGLAFLLLLFYIWRKFFKIKSQRIIVPPGNHVVLFQDFAEGVIWRYSGKKLF